MKREPMIDMNVGRWMIRCCVLAVALDAGETPGQSHSAMTAARQRMVDEEIVASGVRNSRVIKSMRETPRHEFVPMAQRSKYAYLDMALPIGESQTISPPFVVAYMTEALDPQKQDKVLEIGTGSGYQAAVLSPLVHEVYTIEIVKSLGLKAARTLRRLGYDNVHVKVGDGYKGWPEHAPFDKIIVTCSPEGVPPALTAQLKEGGRMVIPVGERYQQMLYLMRKTEGKIVAEAMRPTLFVPMTGRAEDRRRVLPDPANPTIRNGDFELVTGEPPTPVGWHYQRQLELITDGDAPSGRNFVTFRNAEPGRGCRALQGMAIDGRKVNELDVSLHVRGKGIRPGQSRDQLPLLVITFYGQNRGSVGHAVVGPWRGTFSWQRETARLRVPKPAREAVVRIGLLGAVGEIAFDAIRLKAVK